MQKTLPTFTFVLNNYHKKYIPCVKERKGCIIHIMAKILEEAGEERKKIKIETKSNFVMFGDGKKKN